MTRALLDINVLLALLDSDHADHIRARSWIDQEISHGWASCAITQNGFVRIISQPRYPSPISPAEAIKLLAEAVNTHHHEFWKCEISLLDQGIIDSTRLHGSRQVTDTYLLALATQNGGRFATFDQTVPVSAVVGATEQNLALI
ncbi:MAG: TA system VapC family ribonuclease toxin [Actinomycetota bacterium]